MIWTNFWLAMITIALYTINSTIEKNGRNN